MLLLAYLAIWVHSSIAHRDNLRNVSASADGPLHPRAFVPGAWSLSQPGRSGVSVMMLAITSESTAILLDKVERNSLTVTPPGGTRHFAWAAELNLNTQAVRPLNPLSNTWCATGSFLSNGTFVSSGGNPVALNTGTNGLQALRLFTPCPSTQNCDIFEQASRVRLSSRRWYPSSARLEDGSVIIWGGSTLGGFINAANVNNPTYEFYPPKNIHGFNGLSIPSQFMRDTLNANHFPNLILLPNGSMFVSANRAAMLFDWRTNTQTALPDIPNGVRISSPFSAGAVLLPLRPENGYEPEVLICGGSTISDTANPSTLTPQIPASAQCIRMLLTPAGIAAGWQVESMPQPRIMNDLVLLPDGRILIVNGAQSGVAGFGFVRQQVGQSAADNPTLTPVIYDPTAPAGNRFSSAGIPASPIPRMYHSTASLTPNGTILLAGSNPNGDVTTTGRYPTEYRLEYYSPPYMALPRPTYTGLPAIFDYNTVISLAVQLPPSATTIEVSLIDLGFATHGVHMDARFVKLVASLSEDKATLAVSAPPNSTVYPPGPGYVYVVVDGVPSFGSKTLIGSGGSPPVDLGAISNLLARSSTSSSEENSGVEGIEEVP